MGAGLFKSNMCIGISVNHKPVRFNMAFVKVFPIARKPMLSVFRRENISADQYCHCLVDLRHILMAFFHEFIVFFELSGSFWLPHRSGFQVCQKLLGGIIGFCLFFAAHYISCFLHCSQSNGIERGIFSIKRAILPVNTMVISVLSLYTGGAAAGEGRFG